MSDETDEQIKNRLKEIFPSPAVSAAVTDLVVSNKPPGWSHRSNATYYKRIYAEQIRTEIDKMIVSGSRIVWRYSVWCDQRGMTPNTLYARINQSIRFLIEPRNGMDPDGKYRKWNEMTKRERHAKVGIVIEYIAGFGTSESFAAEEVSPRETMPRWKQDMYEWIESDKVTPFCVENLCLDPDEIAALKTEISQLYSIQASIQSSHVKLIRLG